MRRYGSLSPVTVDELIGRTGWFLGPGGDSILDSHGNEVFVHEDEGGFLVISAEEGVDLSDLLEQVPFELMEDVSV